MSQIDYRRRNRMATAMGWFLLIVFTTATVVVNVWAANLARQNAWLHGIVPVIVLAAALWGEVYALANAGRVSKIIVTTINTLVFLTVLGLSYIGVLRVLEHEYRPQPGSVEAILVFGGAAVPDALMIAAGVGLISLRIHAARSEAVEDARPSVFGSIGAEVGGLATSWLRKRREMIESEPVTKVPERVGNPLLNGAEHRAAVSHGVPAVNGSERPEGVGNRFENTAPNVSNTSVEPFENISVEVPEQFDNGSSNAMMEVPEPEPTAVATVPEPERKPQKKVLKPTIDPELEPFMDAARWMLKARRVSRKKPEEIAAWIKLIDEGLTPAQIRGQLGGGVETIENVARAWREWQRMNAQSQPEPLTAAS